jgi:hypothetical protein
MLYLVCCFEAKIRTKSLALMKAPVILALVTVFGSFRSKILLSQSPKNVSLWVQVIVNYYSIQD